MNRSMPASCRAALSVALVGLLSLSSCDIGGDEGGPGSSPGIFGGVPPGPLTTPPPLGIKRSSNGSAEVQSNGFSYNPSVSSTGQYVAFLSSSTNLVPGDTNFVDDIFVRDTVNDTTVRVSVTTTGLESNGYSYEPFISSNGRFVVFQSSATNLDLLTADNNGYPDIFLHNRSVSGAGAFDQPGNISTIRVNLGHGGIATQANNYCYTASVSDDGNRVAFYTNAGNLVAGDTNGYDDVFVREVSTNSTWRLSVEGVADGLLDGANANGFSFGPSISANGQFVSFMSSAADLVAGDTNGYYDIFRATVGAAPTIARVSIIGLTQPNSYCYTNYFHPGGRSISADGNIVAFASTANNLAPFDTNQWDVFVRNMSSGSITRILGTFGEQPNDFTFDARVSLDGTKVVFQSNASNIGPDFNFTQDIFVKSLTTGALALVSVSTAGAIANNGSENAVISGDGTKAVFTSYASNLVDNDTNSQYDIFMRDLGTGETLRVSRPTAGSEAQGDSGVAFIAASGPIVVFESSAPNILVGDTNGVTDVFFTDVNAQTTSFVSKNSVGVIGTGPSSNPVCSADGRFVAFESDADNFVDRDFDGNFNDDTNSQRDIFVHDRVSGLTVRVSVNSLGDESNGGSINPSISATGRYVAFESTATNFVDIDDDGIFNNDTNGVSDIFVHDLVTGVTTRVSESSTDDEADLDCYNACISGDGAIIVFQSSSSTLDAVATGANSQIFAHDMTLDTTTCVSAAAGVEGDFGSNNPVISANGRIVAFESGATNFDALATSGYDVFVRDLQSSAPPSCASVAGGVGGDSFSFQPALSSDGRFVSFTSFAANLDPAATGAVANVFLRDRQGTGATFIISVDDLGAEGDDSSFGSTISGDGRWVSFVSAATTLVTPDGFGFLDVFVRGPLFP